MLPIKSKLTILIVILCGASSNLYGHGTQTHATISAKAYDAATNIQSNFFQALGIPSGQPFVVDLESRTARSWTIQGSIREDTGTLPIGFLNIGTQKLQPRPIFHFFDPHNGQGLSGSTLGGSVDVLFASPSPKWSIEGHGAGDVCLLPGIAPPISCGLVISFQSDNDFPYSSSSSDLGARNEFFNGLTLSNAADRNRQFGLMFRSLGQTIHLLQDTAQPQHVRNDQHLDLGLPPDSLADWFQNPSIYERYVDARPDLQAPASTYNPPTFQLPQDFFANGVGAGMAEFTNHNFVSDGTNCTVAFIKGRCDSAGGYPLPVINQIDNETFVNIVYHGDLTRCQHDWQSLFPTVCNTGVLTFFGNNVHDANTATDIQNNFMTTFSIFDRFLVPTNKTPGFTLNHFDYDQQAALLIPRATGFSAGLLNYFFRGSMLVDGVLATGIQITNNSVNIPTVSEDMNGTFSVYYERNDGTRQPVPGANASLLIPQSGIAPMPSFVVPNDAVQPATFTLVFQGKLGMEANAVAGKQFRVANLTTSKSGTGIGTVSSSPAGVKCDQSCTTQSTSIVVGTTITLTAVPDPNSTFSGWSGDCTGTASSITLVLAQDQFCTATFTQQINISNISPTTCPAPCTIPFGDFFVLIQFSPIFNNGGTFNSFIQITWCSVGTLTPPQPSSGSTFFSCRLASFNIPFSLQPSFSPSPFQVNCFNRFANTCQPELTIFNVIGFFALPTPTPASILSLKP